MGLISAPYWDHPGIYWVHHEGEYWAIKDYAQASSLFKYLLGPLLVVREYRAYHRLSGLEGFPQGAFVLDRYALCYRFVAGTTLRELKRGGRSLSSAYFVELEWRLETVHEHGIAHLDTANLRNILVGTEDARPVLIDFASCVFLDGCPRRLADFLRHKDYAGIYKSWTLLASEPLDEGRQRFFDEHYRKNWLKPKRAAKRVVNPIRRLFHHPGFRRGFRRLRVPLGLATLVLIASRAQPDWFWCGAAVAAAGALLQAWAFACIHTQQRLARDGPYSLLRNPQYLGRFILVLGLALVTASPWLMLLFTVLYYFYVTTRVEREEARLHALFGEAYERYRLTVPRFLPDLRRLDAQRLRHWDAAAFRANHGARNLVGVFTAFALIYGWAFHLAPVLS